MIDKTTMIRIVILFIVGIPGSIFAQQPAGPMALVNGDPISAGEVEKAAAEDLESLELRRVQFEVQLQRDRESAMEDGLDRVVRNRLLDLEAKKRKISVDDLIAIEVDGVTTVPSDEMIVAFYNANKAMIDGSLADNASRIQQYLREQQRQTVFDAFVAKLTRGYGVKSFIEPIRTSIPLAGHPTKGPENAAVTIVEFADFECPYCGALFSTLQKIEADYKDKLNVVYYQFPLVSIHQHAQKAAEASLCANEQGKFWQIHDAMFNDQQHLTVDDLNRKAKQLSLDTEKFSSCLDADKYFADIRKDVAEGSRNGISGTPAMFINGRLLIGNQAYGDIQKIIEDELRRVASR